MLNTVHKYLPYTQAPITKYLHWVHKYCTQCLPSRILLDIYIYDIRNMYLFIYIYVQERFFKF